MRAVILLCLGTLAMAGALGAAEAAVVRVVPPPVVVVKPPAVKVKPAVVYVAPAYPAPRRGSVWKYRAGYGWVWYHPRWGWHHPRRGWRW